MIHMKRMTSTNLNKALERYDIIEHSPLQLMPFEDFLWRASCKLALLKGYPPPNIFEIKCSWALRSHLILLGFQKMSDNVQKRECLTRFLNRLLKTPLEL